MVMDLHRPEHLLVSAHLHPKIHHALDSKNYKGGVHKAPDFVDSPRFQPLYKRKEQQGSWLDKTNINAGFLAGC